MGCQKHWLFLVIFSLQIIFSIKKSRCQHSWWIGGGRQPLWYHTLLCLQLLWLEFVHLVWVCFINKFDSSVILLVSCLVELKLSIFTVISTLARSSAAFGFAVSCLVLKQKNHLLHHQHETIWLTLSLIFSFSLIHY